MKTHELLAHAYRIKMYFEKFPPQDVSVLANVNIVIETLTRQLAEGI